MDNEDTSHALGQKESIYNIEKIFSLSNVTK